MKTSHKRKAERIGDIIDGTDLRQGFYPDRPRQELEEITIAVLDESIRLEELAYKSLAYRPPRARKK